MDTSPRGGGVSARISGIKGNFDEISGIKEKFTELAQFGIKGFKDFGGL